MKTSKDPRHLKRIKIMQELFAWDFKNEPEALSDSQNGSDPKPLPDIAEILADIKEIDHLIEESAPSWPIEKINKIDLSILRLGIFELLKKDAPTKVIVDEAVELAKSFGSESSASFVNGVLGKVIDDLKL